MKIGVEARARIAFAAVVLVAALAALAWWLSAVAHNRIYEIRSREPVSGLIAGAPVEFHGVEVGKVRAVELAGPRLVRILVQVRRDAPISSTTVATVTGRGLAARGYTGYVYISLEDQGSGGQPLAAEGQAYPAIAAGPPQSETLDSTFQQLNQSLQGATALLQSALDPKTVAELKSSLANLDQVSHTLAANNARLAAILANAESASARAAPLLARSEAAVGTLQAQVLPQAQGALRELDALTSTMNTRLDTILHNTEQASTHLAPLLQSSNDAARALQNQVLPQAERTLVRLDHLSSSLDDATARIRRNPSLLLRGTSAAPGPGEAP